MEPVKEVPKRSENFPEALEATVGGEIWECQCACHMEPPKVYGHPETDLGVDWSTSKENRMLRVRVKVTCLAHNQKIGVRISYPRPFSYN